MKEYLKMLFSLALFLPTCALATGSSIYVVAFFMQVFPTPKFSCFPPFPWPPSVTF